MPSDCLRVVRPRLEPPGRPLATTELYPRERTCLGHVHRPLPGLSASGGDRPWYSAAATLSSLRLTRNSLTTSSVLGEARPSSENVSWPGPPPPFPPHLTPAEERIISLSWGRHNWYVEVRRPSPSTPGLPPTGGSLPAPLPLRRHPPAAPPSGWLVPGSPGEVQYHPRPVPMATRPSRPQPGPPIKTVSDPPWLSPPIPASAVLHSPSYGHPPSSPPRSSFLLTPSASTASLPPFPSHPLPADSAFRPGPPPSFPRHPTVHPSLFHFPSLPTSIGPSPFLRSSTRPARSPPVPRSGIHAGLVAAPRPAISLRCRQPDGPSCFGLSPNPCPHHAASPTAHVGSTPLPRRPNGICSVRAPSTRPGRGLLLRERHRLVFISTSLHLPACCQWFPLIHMRPIPRPTRPQTCTRPRGHHPRVQPPPPVSRPLPPVPAPASTSTSAGPTVFPRRLVTTASPLDPGPTRPLASVSSTPSPASTTSHLPRILRCCSSVVATALLSNHASRPRPRAPRDPRSSSPSIAPTSGGHFTILLRRADQVAHLTGARLHRRPHVTRPHEPPGGWKPMPSEHLSCTGRDPSGEVRAAPPARLLQPGEIHPLLLERAAVRNLPLPASPAQATPKLHYPTLSCPRKEGFLQPRSGTNRSHTCPAGPSPAPSDTQVLRPDNSSLPLHVGGSWPPPKNFIPGVPLFLVLSVPPFGAWIFPHPSSGSGGDGGQQCVVAGPSPVDVRRYTGFVPGHGMDGWGIPKIVPGAAANRRIVVRDEKGPRRRPLVQHCPGWSIS